MSEQTPTPPIAAASVPTVVTTDQANTTNTGNVQSGQPDITTLQTTTFEESSIANTLEVPLDNSISQLSKNDSNHTIIQFLERPVLIVDKKIEPGKVDPPPLSQTTNRDHSLFVCTLPQDVLALGDKLQKVRNFEYLQGEIVIRLTIYVNTMTSFLGYLAYSPYDNKAEAGRNLWSHSIPGQTAFPGVFINPQVSNTVELVVPYEFWAEALSLTDPRLGNNDESFASVYLIPITQLRSGGGYSMTVQAWAYFRNVTLVGPTNRALRDGVLSEEELVKRRLYEKYNAEMQIQSEAGSGVISSVASTVSGIADSLTGLPLVGEIASTVGWVADLVGGVASIFGWSKPQTMEPVCRVNELPGAGFTHTDGINNSVVLGLKQDNELGKPVNVFPSNVDEMEIDYVCRNPAVIGVLPYSTKIEPNTIFPNPFSVGVKTDDLRVGKDMFPIAGAPEGKQRYNVRYQLAVTPLEYVANMFQFWRGTICFKFSVVKTAFHSGKLEFFFVPQTWSGELDMKNRDTTNTYRYILDIANETEITIRIPFLARGLVERVSTHVGYVAVKAITPLMAPDTVSDTVDIVVQKWGEGMLFQFPNRGVLRPFNVEEIIPPKTQNADMQIGLTNVASGNVTTFFDEESRTDRFVKIPQLVGGEVIRSLRSLCRSSQYVKTISTNDAWLYFLDLNTDANDNIGYLARMYRFYRGGTDWKIFWLGGYETVVRSWLVNASPVSAPFNKSDSLAPEHITYTKINPVHEISVPYYSRFRKLPTLKGVAPPEAYLRLQANKDTQLALYRAGKDDFSLGSLVGPPSLMMWGSPVDLPKPPVK